MIRTLLVANLMAAASLSLIFSDQAARGATIFTDDFESGLGAWTTNNPVPPATPIPTTTAAPSPKGLSFVQEDGATTRISRGFSVDPAATSVKLSYEFYTNNTSTNTQRYYGQLSRNAASPAVDGSFARLAANNLPSYRFLYFNGATQQLDTAVNLAVGWHQASLTVTPGSNTMTWTLDSAFGSVNNTIAGGVQFPNAVSLGNSFSNGVAGAPDTSAWFDTIKVEQFAPDASAVTYATPQPSGTGGIGLNADLGWTPGANNSFYDVFLDTNPNPTTLVSPANFSGTTFDPGPLLPNTIYYWRVNARNVLGDPGSTGSVQSFNTVPEPSSLALFFVAALAFAGKTLVSSRRKSQG